MISSCTREAYKEAYELTGNPIAAAILTLAENTENTSQGYWDNFGHELCLSLRSALFGNSADHETDIRQCFEKDREPLPIIKK